MISRSNRLRILSDSTWFLFWETQIFHVYKTVYSPHESVFGWCQIVTMNFYLSIYQSLKSFLNFLTNKIDVSTNDEKNTINSFVKNSSRYFLNNFNSIIDKLYIDSNENILFFVFIAWFCESCSSNLFTLTLSKTFAKSLYFLKIFFNNFIIVLIMKIIH
jgi:hypothetical protein